MDINVDVNTGFDVNLDVAIGYEITLDYNEIVYFNSGGGGGNGATIDDATISTTTTWSSSKINTELGTKADTSHTHSISDVSNLQTTLDAKVDKPATATADDIAIFDTNKNVIDSGKKLSDYALVNHTHALGDLSNVDETSKSDGQALVWDATASTWKPATISGGGGGTVKYYPTHFLSDYTDLASALTAIGSNEAILLVDRDETISVDTAIPKNVALLMKRPYKFTINDTIKFTINGEILAGRWQIFNILGTGRLWGYITNRTVKAEWFGVSTTNADNSSALTTAWTQTINLKSDYLTFGAGKYLFTSPVNLITTGNGGVRLIGAGTIHKPIFKNQYPDETSWTGTILDFRPVGTNYAGDLLTFGDNNVQVTHLGLYGISVVGSSGTGYNVLRIMYAPQKLKIDDLLVLQTGDGDGFKIADVWTGCEIRDLWVWNTNGVRSTIDNVGFHLVGERNAGGDIFLYNINAGGFKIGRMFGKDPLAPDFVASKAERNIFMQGSQTNGAEIGTYIGYGITTMSIFNDWTEGVTQRVMKIVGNSREIALYECRLGCLQFTAGGIGIELGIADSEGYTYSLYKRAKVSINNCYIHGLQASTRGIVRHKQGASELLYINNTVIIKDTNVTDDSDIYGIMFKGDNTKDRSIVLNQVDFTGGSSNATIPESQRIVKADEAETTISDGKDLLRFYVPALLGEEGVIDGFYLTNHREGLRIVEDVDWATLTTNAFNASASTTPILNCINLNGTARAIYLPKTAVSKGKYFIVKNNDPSTSLYINVRYNTADGGDTIVRLYTGDIAILHNVDGTTWTYTYLNHNIPTLKKSSSYTLNYSDTNKILTNTGATAGVTFTLPLLTQVAEGSTITFIATENFPITIKPNSVDRIIPLTNTDGTSITSTGIGDTIKLIAMDNNWHVLNNIGFA